MKSDPDATTDEPDSGKDDPDGFKNDPDATKNDPDGLPKIVIARVRAMQPRRAWLRVG